MDALTARVNELEAQIAAMGNTSNKWPWGEHETDLLRKLESAARRFWVNYDSTDHSTAPTSGEVAKWLNERGVADRVAEIMAQILRAEGIPKGPRR